MCALLILCMTIPAAAYENDIVSEVLTELVPLGEAKRDISLEFSREYDDVRCYLWSNGSLAPYADVIKR